MADLDPFRLPTDVTPTRYALELAPDLEAATFAGTVDIDVEVHAATDQVVLNALELDVDEAWVQAAGGERLTATVTLDEKSERAHLALPEALPTGPAVVHLAFRGVLNDKLHGFYRSRFRDGQGTDGCGLVDDQEDRAVRLELVEHSAKPAFVVRQRSVE